MKSIRSLVASATLLALAASFQPSAAPTGLQAPDAEATQRHALTQRILEKWSPHVASHYHVDDWAGTMRPALDKLSLDALEKVAASQTFDGMNGQVTRNLTVAPKALGDLASDLVYVPIAPCRIIDTRLAGGQIAAGATRAFDVTAVTDYSFQGGSASNCGGAGAAGSFAAVALNFTIVSPTTGGWITAYPYLATKPVAATLNFNANDVRGNFAIVPLDQTVAAPEMNVYSTSLTHLVVDMVGYFRAVTPLPSITCTETPTTDVSVSAGATANAPAPACAAGTTQTSTNCESSTWQMPFVFIKHGTCSAQNNSASTATLRSSRTCCALQ